MSLTNIMAPITYMTFQELKNPYDCQYVALGEKNDGSIWLYKLPSGLRTEQRGEMKRVQYLLDEEVKKCLYQKGRKKFRVK